MFVLTNTIANPLHVLNWDSSFLFQVWSLRGEWSFYKILGLLSNSMFHSKPFWLFKVSAHWPSCKSTYSCVLVMIRIVFMSYFKTKYSNLMLKDFCKFICVLLFPNLNGIVVITKHKQYKLIISGPTQYAWPIKKCHMKSWLNLDKVVTTWNFD